MAVNDEPVYVQCPKCHHEHEDWDGFGLLWCEFCGYCEHPAGVPQADGTITCAVCGRHDI